ncbi:MAG: hypothetical protein ACK4UY_15115 [Dietzia sp.]
MCTFQVRRTAVAAEHWRGQLAREDVVLLRSGDDGQWVVGTRDGALYLVDLDGEWVAPLVPGSQGARIPGPCWLGEWRTVRLNGTLSMQVTPIGEPAVPEQRVRTNWVTFVEPVDAAPSYALACWQQDLEPREVLTDVTATVRALIAACAKE